MKNIVILTLSLFLFGVSQAPGVAHSASTPSGSPFPLQLEARVPFPPTAFPSSGRMHICYELYLTNFSANPMTLSRIEVLDADRDSSKPIASLPVNLATITIRPT